MSRLRHLLDRITINSGTNLHDKAIAEFLRKLILVCYHGELRVHGRAPNRKHSLADYLLDDRRLLLDMSRLTDANKSRLKASLFTVYARQYRSYAQNSYQIEDAVGRPNEASAGFWTRVGNIFSLAKLYHRFSLETELIRDSYQMNHIDFTLSENGALINFIPRFQVINEPRPTVNEYQDKEHEQDAKRLILTDRTVEKIFSAMGDLEVVDEAMLSNPHPHSISVDHTGHRAIFVTHYDESKPYDGSYLFDKRDNCLYVCSDCTRTFRQSNFDESLWRRLTVYYDSRHSTAVIQGLTYDELVRLGLLTADLRELEEQADVEQLVWQIKHISLRALASCHLINEEIFAVAKAASDSSPKPIKINGLDAHTTVCMPAFYQAHEEKYYHEQSLFARESMMAEYRHNHGYKKPNTLLDKLWIWIQQYFKRTFYIEKPKAPTFDHLYKAETEEFSRQASTIGDLTLKINSNTGQIRVLEPKPDISTFVFCGGGPRLWGHLGAYHVAINEFDLHPKHFAGSSAGAIMSMMFYLGYPVEDVHTIFSWMRQNALVNLDTMNTTGMSNTSLLLDKAKWVVSRKLSEYIEDYPWYFTSGRGRQLKEAIRKKDTKITFAMVKEFKELCPESNIGESILVTSTVLDSQTTEYHSTDRTPDQEMAECVAKSACLPVVFQAIDGAIDGGVTNNLPLNCFRDKGDSFLEHELSLDPSLLAFQFDCDGNERQVIHSNRRIFREGRLSNWFYGITTRIPNPARFWEAERRERRNYAPQVMIIDAKGISATNFDMPEDDCETMYQNGARAAREFLKPRVAQKEQSDEYLARDFENMEELLCYCAYRNRWDYFDKLCKVVREHLAFRTDSHLLSVIEHLNVERPQFQSGEAVRASATRPLYSRQAESDMSELASFYNAAWYNHLLAIVSANWEQLVPVERSAAEDSFIRELMNLKEELPDFETALVVKNKIDKLLVRLPDSPTHILLYLLKQLFVAGSQSNIINDTKLNAALTNYRALLDNYHRIPAFSADVATREWSFTYDKCCDFLESLKQGERCDAAWLATEIKAVEDLAVDEPEDSVGRPATFPFFPGAEHILSNASDSENHYWYANLYPLVFCDWSWVEKSDDRVTPYIDAIQGVREKAERFDRSKRAKDSLLSALEEISTPNSHVLFYLLKTLLRDLPVNDKVNKLRSAKLTTKLVKLVAQSKWREGLTAECFFADWRLDISQSCDLVNILSTLTDPGAAKDVLDRYRQLDPQSSGETLTILPAGVPELPISTLAHV